MTNRPHIQYNYALAIALLLLTIRIGLNSLPTVGFNINASASDITVNNLVSAVNQERTSRNIPSLTYNAKLAAAAQYKSDDMVARNYFAHTDPEDHYIWDKIVTEGYSPYTILGENLAIDFDDTQSLVAAWINSPTHRANLLNINFKDQGMGVTFGDANSGQYSVAVANTFGAQPIAQTPQQTPAPAPTAIPVPEPKINPIPQNAPAQIEITNSASVLHNNSVIISGSANANSSITIKDSAANQQVTITSDANGGFSSNFTNLANGPHTFTAQNGSTTATYKAVVEYNPPIVSAQNITIEPQIQTDQLELVITAAIQGGKAKTVNASIAGKTASMVLGADNIYSTSLSFDKYFDYKNQDLVISAEDQYGNVGSAAVGLSNYALPVSQDPKSISSLGKKTASPDLYNIFKYVVIFFGGLFLLFLLGDTLHLTKNKYKDDMTRGSNIIVLLIMMCTLLLVTWWH